MSLLKPPFCLHLNTLAFGLYQKRVSTCGRNHVKPEQGFILRHINLNKFLPVAGLSKEYGIHLSKFSWRDPQLNELQES